MINFLKQFFENDLFGSIAGCITIIAAIGSVAKLLPKLNHNRVSLTLLSHEERETYQMVTRSILAGAVIFAVVFSSVFINYLIHFEPITTNGTESGTTTNDVVTNIVMVIVFVVLPIIIGIISAYLTYKKEKEKAELIKYTKEKMRYVEVAFYTFVIAACIFLDIVFVAGADTKYVLIVSILLAVIIACFLNLYFGVTERSFYGQVANLYCYEDKEIYYIFETKGDHFIAGNNIYFNECDKYKIIQLKDGLELKNVDKNNIVFLQKENLEIKNSSKSSTNDVLRACIADCKKNNCEITVDTHIEIKAEKDTIKYKIGEQEHSIVNKPVNSEEWDGNVIAV